MGQLDRSTCRTIVTQYLLAQGWTLVDPDNLADRIWQHLAERGFSSTSVIERIQAETWQRYGVILHDCCRQFSGERHERAWGELKAWLDRQVGRLTPEPQEQDDLVQAVLIDLQRRLDRDPLKSPRALWAYALQALRTKSIDQHRRQVAVKRGEDMTLSLEELGGNSDDDKESSWEEHLPSSGRSSRTTEDAVEDEELRRQLSAFFHEVLPTELQRRVAELHFVDDLSQIEIAALMGKRPHEIRMAKSRFVQTLRSLPLEQRERLLAIMGPYAEGLRR